jgi:hypothetical protein
MEKYALNNAEDMWSMHSELALWRKLHANNYGKPVRDSNIALESLDKGFVYELSNNTQGLSSESMKLIEKHLLFRSFMAARGKFEDDSNSNSSLTTFGAFRVPAVRLLGRRRREERVLDCHH